LKQSDGSFAKGPGGSGNSGRCGPRGQKKLFRVKRKRYLKKNPRVTRSYTESNNTNTITEKGKGIHFWQYRSTKIGKRKGRRGRKSKEGGTHLFEGVEADGKSDLEGLGGIE